MEPTYFTLKELCFSETAQGCGINNIPTFHNVFNLYSLSFRLDAVRMIFGKRVDVSSGYRNALVNSLVGGAEDSYHMFGRAADITADDLDRLYEVVQLFEWKECYINKEKNYIHVAI